MSSEIRFKASLSATCLHAAVCQNAGVPAADDALADALSEPATVLNEALTAAGWPVAKSLSALLSLSSEFDNNRQLAERVAARLIGASANDSVGIARIAGAVADLERTLLSRQPDLVGQLGIRGRPLQEQWEARGPGLLSQLGRLCDELIAPAAAEVVLVAPYAGGHGTAHMSCNRVTFEAVLVNPYAELPETLRLAWLVSQLNLDLPRFADALEGSAYERVAQLAMIPPILVASETVELARLDAATLELALRAWRVEQSAATTAERLLQWWAAYRPSSTGWPVALAALGRMLA